MVNHLYNTIDNALKIAVPKSKPRIIDKNNPWWNSYLSKQRRKLDTLYKHQKANKGYCAKEKYKAFRKEYKKDVERARKASWEDYKEKIDSVEEMNKFRKIIERHLNIQMGT